MKHPLAIGITLLGQTILICITSGLLAKSIWFSYILFLIFLGAMLVLFIYVASLASNESFKLSTPLALLLFAPSTLILPLTIFTDPLLPSIKQTIEKSQTRTSEFLLTTQYNLRSIYNPTSITLTLFVILYLLLTLIVVVKITTISFGPLRTS